MLSDFLHQGDTIATKLMALIKLSSSPPNSLGDSGNDSGAIGAAAVASMDIPQLGELLDHEICHRIESLKKVSAAVIGISD
jgi:hypothetical protein